MNRREFLISAGAIAAVSAPAGVAPVDLVQAPRTRELVKPSALRTGDAVAIVAPGTPVIDPDALAVARRTVEHFGLRPRFASNVGVRVTSQEQWIRHRVDDLHAAFRDPDIKGVLALRGGWGSAHLLPHIDYDLIRRNPKVFVGFSDITSLHIAIQSRASLVTFHGPVLLSGFTEYTQGLWRRALFSTEPMGRIENPDEVNQLRPAHAIRTVRGGRARGRLVGGNLTLVNDTLGTPFEIDTRDKLLLLEDVGEQPDAIDRLLTHLRNAGKLNTVRGVIFGECADCGPREFQSWVGAYLFSLGEVIDSHFKSLPVPMMYGFTFGHTGDQATLPLGVEASMDADAGALEILEAGVR